MALNVQTTCTECEQNVRLKGPDVTGRPGSYGKDGSYEFTCPICGARVSKPMGPNVYHLLKTVVGLRWIFPPAELSEINLSAPPLTEDDLLTFAVALYSAPADYIMARAVL